MRTVYKIDSNRIYTGVSKQIDDREGRRHDWVPSDTPPPDGIAQWNGLVWVSLPEYPKPSLDKVRDDAMQRIKDGHSRAMSAITDRFPQTEIDGWPVLVKQAEAGSGKALESYAARLGVTVADAATRLLDAAPITEEIYGDATGTLTTLRDQVDAAYADGDVATLQSIDWPQ